jgi:hypothetical protein
VDRRRFLLTSVAGALAAPRASEAQKAGEGWRVGFLGSGSAAANKDRLETFGQGCATSVTLKAGTSSSTTGGRAGSRPRVTAGVYTWGSGQSEI